MAPKKKSDVGDVDGVPYILNIASRVVVVGTGLVSNDLRDTFKLKAGSSLEEQARARPKFKALVAAAAAAEGDAEGDAEGEADADADVDAGANTADAAADAAAASVVEARWQVERRQLREQHAEVVRQVESERRARAELGELSWVS